MVTNLGSLVQLCCVEGGTLQTSITGMCGELTVDGPHWVSHSPRWHVLPRSTLLRLQGALQGHCPKWALGFMHFPGLSCSGSRVLRTGTDPAGQATRCLGRALSQVGRASYSPPWSRLLSSPDVQQEHSLRSVMCPLWRTDLRLQPYWQMSTVQDPRQM